MSILTFDFESEAIQPRPDYPPKPVGLATGTRTKGLYLAWGHPTGNDSKPDDGIATLRSEWYTSDLLCHNAAFDIAVAVEQFQLPMPAGRQINDTMFLAFLLDPYGELALKPLAERYLGIPPTERDAVRDWLYNNKVIKRNVKRWGAFISKAPGELVRPYAIGDVTRTRQLYDFLLPMVKKAGMLEAYRRECNLMPMLLQNSAMGIQLDRKRLAEDTERFEEILKVTERTLRRVWQTEIGSTPPANFDSNDELADSIERSGKLVMPKTATGKRSVAKGNIETVLPNGKVKGLLLYRSAIEKSLSTYMRPWREQGARLHCNWNQVRSYEDEGARTGRLSSSPNLQNITNPDRYEELHRQMVEWGCGYKWVEFPNLRSYIVAPKGQMLYSLDYSQQELRMLAHYEEGALAQALRDNPDLDIHVLVQGLIRDSTGMDIKRKQVKNINFAKIYGAGIPKMAAQMGIDEDTTRRMVDAYEIALPSVKNLQDELKERGRAKAHLTTLGGRRYLTEPASMVDERLRTYEYKLLNYLIQGSSADQTKEAMVNWHSHLKHSDARFLLTVHDELVGCAPKSQVKKESVILSECMRDAFKLDVPVMTDAKFGVNFGEMKK